MAKNDHLHLWILGSLIFSASLLNGDAWARSDRVPPPLPVQESRDPPDRKTLTMAEIRQRIPSLKGQDVTLLPLQALTFLPRPVASELVRSWRMAGRATPEVIVVANGVYDLERLERLIHDSAKFTSAGRNGYRSQVPVYIAPTATLVISGVTLQLSSKPLAPLLFHGRLILVDARIAATAPAPRTHREGAPYLLGWHGARLVAANSRIEGLGHPGHAGASGLTLFSPKPRGSVILDLRRQLERRPDTTAVMVGNDLGHNFTGFQAVAADKVILSGNRIHDSLSDNIRLRGPNSNVLLNRNFIYTSKRGHGLFLSMQSPGSHVGNNLILLNHGDGIRLNHNSREVRIEANFVADNFGNGITLHEGNHNLILHNQILRNAGNGVRIRNGCQNRAENNVLFHNIRYGAEISAEKAGHGRSPEAGAEFIDNVFDDNLLAALASRGGAGLRLLHNRFPHSAPRYFAGELAEYAPQALRGNQRDGFSLRGDNGCR